MRQAKQFIPSPAHGKEALLLSRKNLRLWVELTTGHIALKYHLSKLKLADDERCSLCYEEAETPEHLLCNCPAVSRRRTRYPGSSFLSVQKIRDIRIPVVLNYVNSLEVL